MPPELVPPALGAAVVVVFLWRTVLPLPEALGEDPLALGDLPTDVALAAGPG